MTVGSLSSPTREQTRNHKEIDRHIPKPLCWLAVRARISRGLSTVDDYRLQPSESEDLSVRPAFLTTTLPKNSLYNHLMLH